LVGFGENGWILDLPKPKFGATLKLMETIMAGWFCVQEKLAEFEKKLSDERQKRLEERRQQRKDERRQKWLREKEEDEQRQKDEELKRRNYQPL